MHSWNHALYFSPSAQPRTRIVGPRMRQYRTKPKPSRQIRRDATQMRAGKGFVDRSLTSDEIREIVSTAADELQIDGKRVLTIIPDGTRTMPMPLMFELLQQEVGGRAAACDYLVALGTHPLMRAAQLSSLVGQSVVNGVCGTSKILNHRWDLPGTFSELGKIPKDEVIRISGGLLEEAIPVRINRMIFDYDQILICGPVFPHEVVGFSGGNKYLFPGIGGPDILNFFHWLGAVITNPKIIGKKGTPVRRIVDRAAAMVPTPRFAFCMAVHEGVLAGLYAGAPEAAWSQAADLSDKLH